MGESDKGSDELVSLITDLSDITLDDLDKLPDSAFGLLTKQMIADDGRANQYAGFASNI
jgi:hypothetical protein